ncbi:MAG: NAD kinase [Bacteroides sp.]|nr:NAD kinase [Bacteroides sp.]
MKRACLHNSRENHIFAPTTRIAAHCPTNNHNPDTTKMTIAIFGNSYKKQTIEEVTHILHFMREKNVSVLLSRELRNEMNLRDQYPPYTPETEEEIDFALSVGGDGTFLYSASQVIAKNIPILGINCGHLGFLTEVQTCNSNQICEQLVNNQYTIEQRSLLCVNTLGGGHAETPFALNEIAVMKQELSSMITVEVWLNNQPLHAYKADGLLISTPTGSTAYNLSVGGPLMVPQTKSLIISPIATHSLNVRPLVIPDDWKIDLHIKSRSHNYLLSVDGRSQTLKEETSLHIEKATQTVKLVQTGEHSFFNSLREKLFWGID